MAGGRGPRPLSFLGSAKRRRVRLEQLDHATGFGLVGEGDRDALAVGGAHAGDATRLPIGLPEHMPDGGNLLHHGLVDPALFERIAVTVRAQEPLRKESRPAFDAAPVSTPSIHPARSNTAPGAVPP